MLCVYVELTASTVPGWRWVNRTVTRVHSTNSSCDIQVRPTYCEYGKQCRHNCSKLCNSLLITEVPKYNFDLQHAIALINKIYMLDLTKVFFSLSFVGILNVNQCELPCVML